MIYRFRFSRIHANVPGRGITAPMTVAGHRQIYEGEIMIIGEVQKGTDKIMVTVKEFKGKTYVDIRTFFENDQGEMVPTKKKVFLSRRRTWMISSPSSRKQRR